jgi:hypothetical protein
MIIDTSTFVDPIIYNRIPHVREKIDNTLREDVSRMAKERGLDICWNTEKWIRVEVKGGRRCEDRLLIQLEVDAI